MFQTNTPNDPPAATLTATATPSAATVRGRTNFSCSRRLALRRSPYRHVASSSRGDTASASDRKSTRLNSSHDQISYAVFCLKKKKQKKLRTTVITSTQRVRL